MVGNFAEGNGISAEFAGEGMGLFHGAVGDNHPADAVFMKVAGRQFDGFAGADQQHSMC